MKNFLDLASRKYYEGDPIISDSEFDSLAKQWSYTKVGYTPTDAYPHAWRMHSLQKLQAPKFHNEEWVVSPKFDGAAVSILYINQELEIALTRGDGIQGKDITDNMEWLVPPTIPMYGVVQITGEVCAYKSVKNARNYAAGALGLKNDREFADRDLTFIAYDIQTTSTPFDRWTTAMEYLHEHSCFCTAYTMVHTDMYPKDGVVYRIDDYEKFEEMGYTAHHPRGAYAVKEADKGYITTLRDVTWQLGKSGIVSPVAHFDPIEIGGATVSKATLHNKKYMDDLSLELNCKIEVIRSGEIIPRVVRRVDD